MKFLKGKASHLVFVFFTLVNVHGQDTLVFINGKYKTNLQYVKHDNEILEYVKEKKHTIMVHQIPSDQVLAVLSENNKFIVTYFTNDTGISWTEDEMFSYVQGMHDARDSYSNFLIPTTSFAISSAAGFFAGVPFGLLVPVAIPVSKAIHRPKAKHLPITDEQLEKNNSYVEGYSEVTKAKKIKSSAIASSAGFLIGLLTKIYVFGQK